MAREQKRSQGMHKEVLKKDTTYEARFMHDYVCKVPPLLRISTPRKEYHQICVNEYDLALDLALWMSLKAV